MMTLMLLLTIMMKAMMMTLMLLMVITMRTMMMPLVMMMMLVLRGQDDATDDDDDAGVAQDDATDEDDDDDAGVAQDDTTDDGDTVVAQDEDKLYLCVSSPTIKDKPVRVNLIQKYEFSYHNITIHLQASHCNI